MKCLKCGFENSEGSKVCIGCGGILSVSSAPQVPINPQPTADALQPQVAPVEQPVTPTVEPTPIETPVVEPTPVINTQPTVQEQPITVQPVAQPVADASVQTEPAPVTQPTPPTEENNKKKNNMPLIIILVTILIIAAAIGIYMFLGGSKGSSSGSGNGGSDKNKETETSKEFKPKYYEFGDVTTSSSTTPPSGHIVYAALDSKGNKGICINRGGQQYCFQSNNWDYEKEHVQQAFSDISCYVSSTYVDCEASGFYCYIYSYDLMACGGYDENESCTMNPDSTITCN